MTVQLPERIAQNIGHFTGRTWLLPKIIAWFEQSHERVLLLTGEPGTGKSMVAAWLAGAGPAPADPEARAQLKKVRSWVKATHFCVAASGSVAPRALAHSFAEQLTRNVSGFSQALLDTLPDKVHIVVDQDVDTVAAGSIVTGVYIGQLDLGALDEEASFDRTLRRPLQKLYANGYKPPMLLLVDALDEALTYSGSTDLVRLLARLADLPLPVHFLLTTRPDPRVLKYYREAQSLHLIHSATCDEDDVRLYTGERLAALPAAQRSNLARRISQAAAGNFLYAHLMLEDLLPRLPDIPDLDKVPLPKGLSGLYHDFLNRELGRDVERWYGDFEPVLGLIAVSQGDGLARAQLERIAGQDVRLTLLKCKQYLQGSLPDGPFRPFHQSFADFLLQDKDNLDYHINASSMHRQLARHYWDTCRGRWQQCDDYGLRHLPAHLATAGQREELGQLLLSFDWLQPKLQATDVAALIADYDLLPQDVDLHLVQGALRLSAHVLARDKLQLASQLLGRLLAFEQPAVQGLLQQAKQWRGPLWLRPLTASLTPPGGPLLRTLMTGHTDWIKAVAVTPDGARAISASDDGTLKVWDLANGAELRTLAGHTRQVNAVAVTPDGGRAISGSHDKTLKVWDLASGAELRTLAGHTREVSAVAVTPDGGRAISASYDKTLKVWDLASGAELRTLRGDVGWFSAVAVTPDGGRAISASHDDTLKVWDLASGAELRTLAGHTDDVTAVVVTPDGRWAISASSDRTLKVWDLASGAELRTLRGHTSQVTAVAVTPDGGRAISASWDNTLKVWDLGSGAELRTLSGHTRWVRAVAVTPDGGRAISGSDDRTLKVWDLASEAELRLLVGHTSLVTAVAVTPDGRRAISGSDDNTLKVWNLESGAELHTLVGHADLVRAVAVTPDGGQAISASDDKMLRVWNLESGAGLHTLAGHTDAVRVVAVTPDGGRIVSGSGDGTLKVWDLESGAELRTLAGYRSFIRVVAVTPDGRRVISASDDSTLKVWDLASGAELRTLAGHAGPVEAVAVTPDGRQAISASGGWTPKVWDLASGAELRTLAGHTGGVNAVAVTPDGGRVISASDDSTLKVWDLANGAELRTLAGHTSFVRAVAVTPDGERAISASYDHTLKVWDLQSGTVLASFDADGCPLACAAAPDGVTVVAGDAFGRVHILRLQPVA